MERFGRLFGTLLEQIDHSKADVRWGRMPVYFGANAPFVRHCCGVASRSDKRMSRFTIHSLRLYFNFLDHWYLGRCERCRLRHETALGTLKFSYNSTQAAIGPFQGKTHRHPLRLEALLQLMRQKDNSKKKEGYVARDNCPIDFSRVNYQRARRRRTTWRRAIRTTG